LSSRNKENSLLKTLKVSDKVEKIKEFEENDSHSDNTLLEKSINQAISESDCGLGIRHEEIWEQLKVS
jgi:hypothetical protein